MASAVVRVFRSRAFQGWCLLLLCAELLGIALVDGVARQYDFRAFYAAGHLCRTSLSHLYDLGFQKAVEDQFVAPSFGIKPFYHPSFEALLFVPFSLLPYGPSYLISIAVNCILLGFAYVTGPRHSAFPLARHARAFTFFTFLPVFLTIIVGQDSILFLLLCCLAFRRLEKHDEWGAGFFIGLAMFRPQLAIPIGLLLAVRYGRRFFVSFTAVGVFLAGLSAFLVRKEGVAALTSLISTISLVHNKATAVQEAMSVYPQRMPNLYGLIYICGGRHLSAGTTFLLNAIASVIVFACCAYVVRKAKTVGISFGVAVLGASLLSYHFSSYDAAILVLPILLLSEGIHTYLVVVCYILPYLLFFWGIPDWFALLAPVPLALLIVAAGHVLKGRRRHTLGADGSSPTEKRATALPSSASTAAR
jgi:glycosyl transferase family 87